MPDWGFWEWVAYGTIAVAAFGIAVRSAVSETPNLQRFVPKFLKDTRWGFAPIILVSISALVLILRFFGIISVGASDLHTFNCMPYYGTDQENPRMLEVVLDGRCARNEKSTHYLVAGAFHYYGTTDVSDAPIELKSNRYDIQDGANTMLIPIAGQFEDELKSGARRTNYIVLLVPNNVTPDKITTIRESAKLGVSLIDRNGGPP